MNHGVNPWECRYRIPGTQRNPYRKMNSYKKPLILLLIFLGLGVGIYYLEIGSKPISIPNQNTAASLNVSLSINDEAGSQSYEVPGYIGKTTLIATQSVAKVETSGVGTDAFVTAINNRKANTKKHEFWELIINGKPSQVGAGSYTIQNGDSLLWKLSTY